MELHPRSCLARQGVTLQHLAMGLPMSCVTPLPTPGYRVAWILIESSLLGGMSPRSSEKWLPLNSEAATLGIPADLTVLCGPGWAVPSLQVPGSHQEGSTCLPQEHEAQKGNGRASLV